MLVTQELLNDPEALRKAIDADLCRRMDALATAEAEDMILAGPPSTWLERNKFKPD